jgi:Peptidase A4 family
VRWLPDGARAIPQLFAHAAEIRPHARKVGGPPARWTAAIVAASLLAVACRGPGPAAETDGRWSGYAATTRRFHAVTADVAAPVVTCGDEDSEVSIWVGLDGYDNGIVEQVGVGASCRRGVVRYSAWWEVYPRPIVAIDVAIVAGDVVHLGVEATAAGPRFDLVDTTTGRAFHDVSTLTGQTYASAEVIVERHAYGSLARFGTVTFVAATVDGAPLATIHPRPILMVGDDEVPLVDVGTIGAGGTFTVRWLRPA